MITVEQLRAFCGTALPDAVLQGFIDFVSQAVPCLNGAAVSEGIQNALLLNAAAHLCVLSSGVSGEVTSERSFTGASVTYAEARQQSGLGGTAYGRALLAMDVNQCLIGLFRPSRSIQSVGPTL